MHRLLKIFLVAIFTAVSTAAHADTPVIGKPAPDFALKDQQGTLRKLGDYRGKWLVLYFYPKNDTPGCTTEACSFRDGHTFINGLGAQVVGVSVDDSASHLAFSEKYKLPFPLLADVKGEVATSYGAVSDWKVMKFAKRQTFLIDPKGVLRKVYAQVDPDTHVNEVLNDLRGLIAAK